MRYLILFAVFWQVLNCSAYCDHGITASGEHVRTGICAMDKLNGVTVPFGSEVILPDGTQLVVADRFGAGHNNHLDIWMASEAACWQFGRRWLKCRIEVAE